MEHAKRWYTVQTTRIRSNVCSEKKPACRARRGMKVGFERNEGNQGHAIIPENPAFIAEVSEANQCNHQSAETARRGIR
jgi:hypothetical protein